MKNFRTHGNIPFEIVLVHGGPGAAGEMFSVAEELSVNFGVLEPLQTTNTVNDQVDELKITIENNASMPVILIGYSWGAWLCYLLAAKYPGLVKKLILVSSGPFEEKYASQIMPTRMSRLSKEDGDSLNNFFEKVKNSNTEEKNEIFTQIKNLISKADYFDPIKNDNDKTDVNFDIYDKVWNEASGLRKSGELLNMADKITCPVVAIHGDYDPHPAEGVQKPLAEKIKDFHFILLKNCGHHPWLEKQVTDEFYKTLISEIKN